MGRIARMLQDRVDAGLLPGAVALCRRPAGTEAVSVGVQDLRSGTPMTRTSLFDMDSLGKPFTAALALTLVADGSLDLDSAVERWLPELADPHVLVSPDAPLTQTVLADRPVTVEDLLTLRGGLGFTPDFSSPLTLALISDLQEGPGPRTLARGAFLTAAGALPLAHQPGRGWTYNLGSTLLGLLLERVSDQPLDELMATRIFDPLEMADARWWVPADLRARITSRYGPTGDAEEPLRLVDPPEGYTSEPPSFPDGSGGVIGTVDDWLCFGEMLLGRGERRGRRVLPAELVDAMTSDRLSASDRASAGFFLGEGEGWGYGGSVRADGSYGWAGGAGVSARVDVRRGHIDILFTQVALDGPQGSPTLAAFEEILAS